jgi:hypothetical protein
LSWDISSQFLAPHPIPLKPILLSFFLQIYIFKLVLYLHYFPLNSLLIFFSVLCGLYLSYP